MFGNLPTGQIGLTIIKFFTEKIEELLKAGVSESQIVLDPGMGGFLSSDPAASWQTLRSMPLFCSLGFPLLIGISRKRFLNELAANLDKSIDEVSALVAKNVVNRCPEGTPLSFRVHNPAAHANVFSVKAEDALVANYLENA